MKTKVFKNTVEDVNDLKERSRAAIKSVRPKILVNTWRELMERPNRLRVNGGGYAEGGGLAKGRVSLIFFVINTFSVSYMYV